MTSHHYMFFLVFILSGCGSESPDFRTHETPEPTSPIIESPTTEYIIPDAIDHPWPDFIQTSSGDLLMSYRAPESIQVEKSTDGGITWAHHASIPSSLPRVPEDARMSILSNGDILMLVYNGTQPTMTDFGFVRSTDGGRSWSSRTPITIPEEYYTYGTITEHPSGWSLAVYSKTIAPQSAALWTLDGTSWDLRPIELPPDGNTGLSELAMLEYSPGQYLAAIRSDDDVGSSQDGFYLSLSSGGSYWPVVSTIGNDTVYGDRGRMPRLKKLDDGRILLSYRLYDGVSTQRAVIRLIDNLVIGDRRELATGVNNSAFLYQHNGQWHALYQRVAPYENVVVHTLVNQP